VTAQAFFEILCPVCNEEVPEQGFRRVRIPWKGGRRMRVHAACAPEVEAQGILAGTDGRPLGERPRTAA
jgi:hypothetical protein